MKYTWETHDVVCGRRVWAHNRATNSECIIGYDPGEDDGAAKYALISLADGMVIMKQCTKDILAVQLNHYEYRPANISDRYPDVHKTLVERSERQMERWLDHDFSDPKDVTNHEVS